MSFIFTVSRTLGLRIRSHENLLRNFAILFAVVICNFFDSPAIAGSVNGPYVLWVNLDASADSARVDRIIENFAGDRGTSCNGNWAVSKPLLYIKTRPPLINNALISDVFVKHSSPRKKALQKQLRKYTDDDLTDGFDGVMVHAKIKGESRIMSMTTGKNEIRSYTAALRNSLPKKEFIEDAFCALLPPITRKP